MSIDLASLEPFEICSIRPPTDNYSLTFRLTRNCGWNKCSFCPVYKKGAPFSRRSIDDVKRDVDRAGVLDGLLTERTIGQGHHVRDTYDEVGRRIWGIGVGSCIIAFFLRDCCCNTIMSPLTCKMKLSPP